MEHEYDLIVVGGGPGGATLALVAARRGLKVLLLERARFPRDKICGDLVPFDAIPILRDLGLHDALDSIPRVFADATVIYAGDQRLRVPSPPDGLLTCRRVDFDNLLFQAAKSAVDCREEHRVTQVQTTRGGRVCGVAGVTGDGGSFAHTAKVVAGADGFNSIIARRTGVYARVPKHWGVATRAYYRGVPMPARDMEIYFFSARRPAYLWIFPVDDEVVNVGVGRVVGECPRTPSLRALHEQLVRSPAHASRFAEAEQLTPIQGWNLPLASQRRTIHGDGYILVGDAAGLIDPMWGHGINTAMIAGTIAGELLPAICRGHDYGADALRGYADAVWARLGPGFDHALATREDFMGGEPGTPWEPLAAMRDRVFAGGGELSVVSTGAAPDPLAPGG